MQASKPRISKHYNSLCSHKTYLTSDPDACNLLQSSKLARANALPIFLLLAYIDQWQVEEMAEMGTFRLDSMDIEWYFAVITPAEGYRLKMGRQNRGEDGNLECGGSICFCFCLCLCLLVILVI